MRRMVTADDVRAVAMSLPRTEERLVRDQVKFRVGRLVYVALSRDETSMGFGFPKEERAALVAAQPGEVLHADPVGSALPLGPSVAGRDRPRRDARAGHRCVAHGGTQACRRRVSPRRGSGRPSVAAGCVWRLITAVTTSRPRCSPTRRSRRLPIISDARSLSQGVAWSDSRHVFNRSRSAAMLLRTCRSISGAAQPKKRPGSPVARMATMVPSAASSSS